MEYPFKTCTLLVNEHGEITEGNDLIPIKEPTKEDLQCCGNCINFHHIKEYCRVKDCNFSYSEVCKQHEWNQQEYSTRTID